jgi:hypothetical protein
LKTLYNSLIHPHLSYGIIHWEKAPASKLKRVIVQQKKAIRIINGCNYNAHTNILFKQNKILKIHEIYELQLAVIMYKHSRALLPYPLLQLFIPHNKFHNYNTRNRNNPHVPRHKLEVGKRSIAHMGPLIWNSIPNQIRTIKTLFSFKRVIKTTLLDKY